MVIAVYGMEIQLSKIRIIKLTPPRLSAENIDEQVICIRPHRERIFKISTETYHDKIIFHNYGQGGAGWTFLFGCVNESIRLFEKEAERSDLKHKPIGVIGAGCYGLLTAILLRQKGYQVSIVAKEIDAIASYKSAGFFFPCQKKLNIGRKGDISIA